MKWNGLRMMAAGVVLTGAGSVFAADQVWNDAGADNTWSTNDLNWDAGAAWTNGNSAVFGGPGETVDIANAVSVANITFQTNGYVVADANNDGALTVMGAPSVITVASAGQTGTVSAVVAGSGGFTKAGAGLLNLTATTNTFTGVLRVSAGVLRLSTGALYALGAGGAGNETIVENGAALNFNGAYTNGNTTENLSIAGSGVDGSGVLVNTGASFMNSGLGTITLLGDATIGCQSRIDFRNTVTGNGYTLTKAGGSELAVGVAVTNCKVVINSGNYTYMNPSALGSSDFDTTLNGGGLRSYGSYVLTERLIANGGSLIAAGGVNSLFNIAGRVTLNSNVVATAENGTMLELSGVLDGAGGLTRSGVGTVYVTGNSNTYAGATLVSATLFIGRTNQYAGTLGSGPVTNTGNLYCYSGRLGTGAVVNNGNLYFDATNAFACSNSFFGTGSTAIRYGGAMTVGGSVSSNANFRLGNGALTLTNGADFCAYSEFAIATRDRVNYPFDPTNVTATVNVMGGATLRANYIVFGDGTNMSGAVAVMTGTLNQAGGTVRTTGRTDENNGVRIGHYPGAYGTYNMAGGQLFVGNDYELCIATDGSGWFRQTGGEVFATRVMLNERDSTGGYGRLTVSGGVMNLGSLSGLVQAISNGIAADKTAPYLVELGGSGGVIRAVTNIYSALHATLYGTNANAITFDTTNFAIALSGNLTGAGGLNKTGAGDLALSGTNSYSGATRVLEGTLTPASDKALPAGGVVAFGVAADGACGVLHAPGDLSLAGLAVAVANPELLDTRRHYTIVTYGGALSGMFGSQALPEPWYVYYDWAHNSVQLRAAVGTLIRLY